ncbi:MAG: hypothetical protein JRI36_14045, partial [Deltaproteobacteria bacterium]|nr:hypothetical protein [Deltaproteobacteria bacterium]
MELTAIWNTILRRKWILIQAMFVVGLAAFAMTYFSVPMYDAAAKILLMKAKKGVIDIGSVGSQLASIIETSTDVDVNKVIASSREYVDKMVFRLQLRDEDGNLINASRPEAEAMSRWKAKFSPIPYISVTQYRDTDILVIHGNSPDPEEAAMMANTLAGIMVERNQQLMRSEYKSAKEFLQAQVDKVRKSYESVLKELAEFQKREHTIDLGIETKLASEKMMELLKQKEDNIIDLAQVQAKIRYLKDELTKMNVEYLPASALKASPQLVELKKRLMELRLRLADASTELTEDHPEIVALKEKIKLASRELEKEIAVYRKTAPELLDLQKQRASLEAHLKGVNADIDRYFKALGGIPDKAYQRANIDKEVAAARQTYSRLLEFLYQLGIAEASTLA